MQYQKCEDHEKPSKAISLKSSERAMRKKKLSKKPAKMKM
jgi:hypothetical protein